MPNYYPLFSGAGERYRRYMPFLRQNDIEIHVMTRAMPGEPDESVVDGVKITRFDIGDQHNAVLHQKALSYFQQSGLYPDVVQTLVHFNASAIRPLLHLKRRRIALVYTVTMALDAQHKGIGLRLRRYVLNRILSYLFVAVIVSANALRQRLIRQGVAAKRIRVIPNGVDTSRFCPAPSGEAKQRQRRNLAMQTDALVVLYTGFIEWRKGIEELIPAWRQVHAQRPDLQLWLVGPQPRPDEGHKLKPELADLLAQAPIPYNIHHTGLVDNVEAYLQAGDLYVFPSHREGGMPNSLMEAFATGLPAIITPYLGLSNETGEDGIHYKLVPHEPKAIAESILALADDAAQRHALGQAALALVQRSMTTEQVTASLVALYRDVIA